MTTYENDLIVANRIDRYLAQGYTGVDVDEKLDLPMGTSYHTHVRAEKKGIATYWSTKGMELNVELVRELKEYWDAGYSWVEIDTLLNLPKRTAGFVYIRLGRPWERR
jgi:hypothetical protein